LRCRTEEGFVGLRPFQEVEANVAWLVQNLGLPAAATILDIGCGPGLYSNRLARYGYRVTGLDIAQPLLDYAQAEARKQGIDGACVYRRQSMFDLDDEAEFEAILLFQSIVNRLESPEIQALLAQIHTALKSGGHFVVELQIVPEGFTSTEPTVTENISFLAQSPWYDQFHAWMIRELTFPATSERVTHHLILYPDDPPAEYWSRFKLYPIATLTDLLQACGFAVQAVFGQALGQSLQATDENCFIWAKRKKRK
jgi:SAM-dependent methyltransferase